ncbi:MAG: hypothetical protein U1F76_06605 [Candidatus Competibacteraceae bacterium]
MAPHKITPSPETTALDSTASKAKSADDDRKVAVAAGDSIADQPATTTEVAATEQPAETPAAASRERSTAEIRLVNFGSSSDLSSQAVIPPSPGAGSPPPQSSLFNIPEPLPTPAASTATPAVTPAETTLTPTEAEVDSLPFEQAGVQKLGIIGGKGVGKSYLFQAMVYRTYANQQAGSLAYYLDRGSIRLFTASTRQDTATEVNLLNFVKNYSAWNRLEQTKVDTQRWYRLRLPYRTGLLGRGRSELDVEFFDGSGEGFFERVNVKQQQLELWQAGYLDARIIVFCLPLWVAFPNAELADTDWQARDTMLKGFEQVIMNYRQLRDRHHCTHPVRSILALTMADDRRSALDTLRDRWITPYMDAPERYLPRLRGGHGIALYLANARKISAALRVEFDNSHDPFVSGIPNKLDFNGGRPWLIPLSAIEGNRLDSIERQYPDPDARKRPRQQPVPVHVELPLLVALCERENALM